jgi:UDP-N-acetylmuramoylalanine--D-glutamate ligase
MSILVVGLGKTGQSLLAYAKRSGQAAIAFDTRASLPNSTEITQQWPNLPVYLETLPAEVYDSITALWVSPGVDLNHPVLLAAKTKGLPMLGDVELFARVAKAPIVAITGSNGKSTVTTLVTEMINAAGKRAQIGGNIGIPVLDLLQYPLPDYYVLELSSFQLELTHALNAKAAVVLNISPDHLDRHGSVASYQAAKERVFIGCEHVVVNRSADYQVQLAAPISFGMDEPSVGQFGLRKVGKLTYLAQGQSNLLSVNELSSGLTGQHNVENALAALALTSALNLPMEPQLSILKSFAGLPHRCQTVRELQGVTWINDSKGTNVGATLAALNGLGAVCPGKIILLAGGVGKNADFTELRPAVEKYVRYIVIFGQDGKKIAEALTGLPLAMENSFEGAVKRAKTLAKSGDYVLLSPACASFDMFNNYEHRGQVFINLVANLV